MPLYLDRNCTDLYFLKIQVLDVDRMLAKSNHEQMSKGGMEQGHPVIRTLYDHMEVGLSIDKRF